jgi:hypothetical protein
MQTPSQETYKRWNARNAHNIWTVTCRRFHKMPQPQVPLHESALTSSRLQPLKGPHQPDLNQDQRNYNGTNILRYCWCGSINTWLRIRNMCSQPWPKLISSATKYKTFWCRDQMEADVHAWLEYYILHWLIGAECHYDRTRLAIRSSNHAQRSQSITLHWPSHF